MTAGMVVFCGSCYAVALSENRAYGRVAPTGGMMLIAGWLAILL
jgi:uncharacterized membrane protein YgdD (TMEM256/DUF423 family)